ncbi:MAG TPA: iron-sulfur cluster assembly protein [Bacteroidota bacterium]|nr:iron-sulfur cluster assembly protein [Bacteroidota bacterium]
MPDQQNQAVEKLSTIGVGSREVVVKSDLERKVWDSLRSCYDPEIPVNVVDLGLVYDLNVEEEIPGEANVFVKMTLTAPGCGMGPMIANDVKRKVQQVESVRNVMVELVFDPTWNTNMMSEAAKLMLNIG